MTKHTNWITTIHGFVILGLTVGSLFVKPETVAKLQAAVAITTASGLAASKDHNNNS